MRFPEIGNKREILFEENDSIQEKKIVDAQLKILFEIISILQEMKSEISEREESKSATGTPASSGGKNIR
jgi:hypothetical protein